MANILYLSYDGMTDPLGGSQVLPYLRKLTSLGHRFTLISCEKPDALARSGGEVAEECRASGIDWHSLPYTKKPPILSTVYDLAVMWRLARRLGSSKNITLIHCRSVVPTVVGYRLKRAFGLPLIFDMRAFYADERVDGGLWPQNRWIYRHIFRWFKDRERLYLQEADHVISLTEAGREVLLARPDRAAEAERISVIPCCVERDAFPPVSIEGRSAARARLDIPAEATVAAYLGSVGTWYMLDEMLAFFARQRAADARAIFLMVTRSDAGPIGEAARRHEIPADALRILPASRAEVPVLLSAADYGLFFIRASFSKLASSPVKLGEFFSLELPIVTNQGVGDVDRIVHESSAGVLVEEFTPDAYDRAIAAIAALRPDPARWREATQRWFDLDLGVQRYDAIYRELLRH